MSILDTHMTVGEFVVQRPARARVFEQFGIDYCCGGQVPLEDACRKQGVDPQSVLDALAAIDAATPASSGTDWSSVPLAELCDHIVATHHEYLRGELPRLEGLVHKVAQVHGLREPALRQVAGVFDGLRAELEAHMEKEEQILFPMIRAMESTGRVQAAHCGSVNNPIRVMVFEHDNAGTALEQMRDLTNGYTPPSEACNTYRAMMDGLKTLEADMHQHVHKENNILFPRASALEAQLAGR